VSVADGDPTDSTSSEDTAMSIYRKIYEQHWHEKMCKKFGKEHVANNYSFQDCLEDWIIVNWAWEST